MTKYCLLFCMLLATCYAKKLPDFIKRCSAKDPNLSECSKNAGNEALPHLLQGNKDLNIPRLVPLIIPHVEETRGTLKLKFDNITVKGCDTLSLKEVKPDFATSTGTFVMIAKHIEIEGIYDVKGQILILPITGNGKFLSKQDDMTFNFVFKWTTENRDGDVYIKMKESSLDWDAEKSYYELENLFNGDATLGKEMNKFLNENPKEANKELGGAIIEAIRQIVVNLFDHVSKEYPMSELYSDTEGLFA